MSKKLFTLITSIIGGVATISSAIVTYCQPTYVVAIVAAIGAVSTASTQVLNLFTKKDELKTDVKQ